MAVTSSEEEAWDLGSHRESCQPESLSGELRQGLPSQQRAGGGKAGAGGVVGGSAVREVRGSVSSREMMEGAFQEKLKDVAGTCQLG